jgi:hypothetical protein
MRFVTSIATALLCATFAVHAQETTTKTKSKTKGDDDKAKTVVYTGCLQTGTETRTFTLDKVVPVTASTSVPTGTGGTITSTSTSYVLVPGEQVTLQQHVGHKVQVTGIMIPEGETKTKTKIEREHGADTTIKEKTDSNRPHLRVLSVKELPEPCM